MAAATSESGLNGSAELHSAVSQIINPRSIQIRTRPKSAVGGARSAARLTFPPTCGLIVAAKTAIPDVKTKGFFYE
jgi:hypothetical protein